MFTIGIIGTGEIGVNLAQEVLDHPKTEIGAIVDVNEGTLGRAAEELGVSKTACYTDEAVMYDEHDLDAVILSTPPTFHYDQILDAFEHDVHVLCEKPVVVDLSEARDVVELTEQKSNVLMAGYQRHLNPGFVAARERWRDSDLEPTFVTGELTQDWTDYFEQGTNWRVDPAIGGRGHLFSVGTHVVESILWMTDLVPEAVSADMTFYDDAGKIDMQSSLNVRFENGALASLSDSGTTPATREHIHVWDDDGAVYLDGANWEPCRLTLCAADGTETEPDLDYDEMASKVAAFVEAIETGTEPPATATDVLRVTALLEAAYESARRNEQVPVDLG